MPNQHFDTLGEVTRRFPDLRYQSGFPDETQVYVKSDVNNCLKSEADGLDALRKTNAIRVANVIACGTADRHILVVEAIQTRHPTGDFFERFGRQLAELHQAAKAESYGFENDNFLGRTPQPNAWTSSWTEFWIHSRLEFQLRLARNNGYGGKTLQRLGDLMIRRLDAFLDDSDSQPNLIHGDLWSGNWLCDENNQPALIDPAVYFADREAEFGMTTLFGGLPQPFYDAYIEAWPLSDGWQDRVEIYRLYHVLNHLNLFGKAYLNQAIAIMQKYS